jgi:hypothetical protein
MMASPARVATAVQEGLNHGAAKGIVRELRTSIEPDRSEEPNLNTGTAWSSGKDQYIRELNHNRSTEETTNFLCWNRQKYKGAAD